MTNKKGEEWLEFVWPGYHWYQGLSPAFAYMEDFPRLGYKFSKFAVTYSKGTESFYYVKGEYENNGAKFFKEVKKDHKIMSDILEKVKDTAESIFELGNKWEELNFSKLSNSELVANHKALFNYDNLLWRNGQIQNLLELHNSYLSDYIKELIEKKFDKENLNDIFSVLTTSTYESITEKQDLDFLELLKSKKVDSAEFVKKHWKKYTWMIYGWAGPALPLSYFEDSFTRAKKDSKITDEIEQKIIQKQEILDKQKHLLKSFEGKDRELVILLRLILESKARRIDAHSLTYFIGDQMLVEIGKRVDLSMELMRVVPPVGVPKLFQLVDRNKLEQDYNRVMYWFENGKVEKFNGTKAEKQLEYIKFRLPKIEKVSSIKGSFAYAGKVKGIVRIILDIKNAGKLQRGEILVTRMTDPSYLPIMKIAGAIVTDVGGITCHAAIVAREWKIPCIVGTKIATKVFKNGDLVEVDADRGIVRILEKNNK